MAVVLNKESLIDLIAGWCSGAAAVVCCQPVDTILTRYQAGAKLLTLNSALTPSLATKSAPAATATSTRSLIAQVGISKLWRGTIPMVSAVPFQNALLMAGYGLGKRYGQSSTTEQNGQLDGMVENSSKRNLYWSIFVGGCTGGVLQSFLMSPVELIKVHLQIHLLSPASPSSAAAAPPPMTSMWKGLGATLLRDGIPHGVWFLSYEMAKENLGCWLLPVDAPNATLLTTLTPHGNNRYEEYHKQLTIPLLSGAVAATTAWGVGYPADLIKTRIQAGSTKGILGTAQELMSEPGGLYRGFTLKLLRSIPASMIGFVVYERISQQLNLYM